MGPKISAIILAAGLSSRMGRLKPLLPLGGTTILGRNMKLFREAGIGDVHVVVGHRHAEITPLVEKNGGTSVVNPDYKNDMFSSVLAGLRSLEPDTEAAFILPVDIPLVLPSTIKESMEAYLGNKGQIIRPVHNGRQGHPPIIPVCLVKFLETFSGSGGLRGALSKFEMDTIRVEVPDENIHFDVDTPEDYDQLLHRQRKRGRLL